MTNKFVFEADVPNKKIHIEREFNAPVANVWRAYTERDLLEKWIAPKPWTAETKILDFVVGGIWLYAMVGTDGQKHWTLVEFTAIDHGRSFSSTGMFSNEEGNTGVDAPKSYRVTKFETIDYDRTKVDTTISFTDESTIQMFVQGGFKEGTIASLNQLDELLGNKVNADK